VDVGCLGNGKCRNNCPALEGVHEWVYDFRFEDGPKFARAASAKSYILKIITDGVRNLLSLAGWE
jgi:hypothetical protein